jgi:tRNA G18 (ribose-2'-O)-methylase SpoU
VKLILNKVKSLFQLISIESERLSMRKLTHQELLERQASQGPLKLPLTVILNDIRSLYNVGSIFRTADGVGVEKIWICGITGFPPDHQISKTALGAEDSVDWQYEKDPRVVLKQLKEAGYSIIFLEQIKNSVEFQKFEPTGPTCLVVGNEITGVSDDLLSYCDQAIEIEMAGMKNSLNVSVAFGIVAYHLKNKIKALP